MASAIFDFAEASRKVETVLRSALPTNTVIKTDEGWHGRVHVKVISDALDGKTAHQKQDYVWDILNAELGADAQAVSLVLAYGSNELLD